MRNAVVIGNGIVGKATRKAFGINDYFDLQGSTLTLKEIAARKRYIFICIPTPTVNGEQERDDIFQIIKQLRDYGGNHIYIIRSTVIPGTCRHFNEKLGLTNIVHNPEFLTESTWEKDSLQPDLIVIGADQHNLGKDVEALYKSRFKGKDIYVTDTVTSELFKYSVNAFYALKVVYGNEIYDFAKTVGANYEKIKEMMYKRKWIGKNHLDVMHGGKRGYGGKCLPKDLEIISKMSGSQLLKKVHEINSTL